MKGYYVKTNEEGGELGSFEFFRMPIFDPSIIGRLAQAAVASPDLQLAGNTDHTRHVVEY